MKKILKTTLFAVIATSTLSCTTLTNSNKQESSVSSKQESSVSSKETNFSLDTRLTTWNSQQKIKLLPHQLLPIDYLEKHPDQKGLLVYHYLGTGKTYLAIGLAERYPSKKIVLLVPRFLKTHWQKNLQSYGVNDFSRYSIISHSEPEKLVNNDLSNSIVIIDESHRLVNQLYSSDYDTSAMYSKLYSNIRNSAYKILALTGTPLYSELSDLAYELNLVSGKEVVPFNKNKIRKELTKVNQNEAFFRGHLLESKVFTYTLPLVALVSSVMLSPPSAPVIFGGLFGAIALPYAAKSHYPMSNMSMRSFDPSKLGVLASNYITYYDFSADNVKDYPKKRVSYQDVSYNDYQLNFLMRFADSDLDSREVLMLQQDAAKKHDISYVSLHSSTIQDNMKEKIGSGREIGNLIYKENKGAGELVYPEKFAKIFSLIRKADRPIVVYSHYYYNGILLFKQYLDKMGEAGNYEILHPDLSPENYEAIISKYNSGRLKILLIHPEITEGISLIGTSQLHMLEPSFNKAAQDQIIGRAVRYKSHAHLPEDQRFVDVYVWKQTISNFDLNHMIELRKNWNNNFSEMNFYSERKVIDKNADVKLISPDDRSYQSMSFLGEGTEDIKTLLKNNSIELKYNKESK